MIINLNKARKARAKSEAERKAQENRVRFGRTKAERTLDSARDDKAARDLDGHRRGED